MQAHLAALLIALALGPDGMAPDTTRGPERGSPCRRPGVAPPTAPPSLRGGFRHGQRFSFGGPVSAEVRCAAWAARGGAEVRGLGGARWRLDTFFSEPAEDDRTVVSVAPTLWWNDASDLTLGIRLRTNDMGRYNRWTVWVHRGVWDAVPSLDGVEAATVGESVDFYLRFRNPIWMRRPGATQSIEGWSRDGTIGGRVALGWEAQRSFATADVRRTEVSLLWVATRETRFLDRRLWENAGTVEAAAVREWDRPDGVAHERLRLEAQGGVVYTPNTDPTSSGTYRGEPFGRVTATASLRTEVLGFGVGVRLFGGGYLGDDLPVLQRRIPINGADPYQNLRNPFVRTSGAPLVDPDIYYHTPGNLNLRAYRPDLGGRWGGAANIEVERDIVRREEGVFRRLALVAFWDAAVVDTVAVASLVGRAYRALSDGGGGVRGWFHLGDVTFPVRVEFPLYVSAPFSAHNNRRGNDFVEFRWLVSVQPIF